MPDYVIIEQLPELSFPATLSMVLERHGIEVGQIEIANTLGIGVSYQHNQLRRTIKPGYMVGDIDTHKLDKQLKEWGSYLRTTFVKPSEVKSVKSFLDEQLTCDHDVMMLLYCNGDYNPDYSHWVTLADMHEKVIEVADPAPEKSYWSFNLDDMLYAMEPERDGVERGFLVFE